jgi:hypothetical protein
MPLPQVTYSCPLSTVQAHEAQDKGCLVGDMDRVRATLARCQDLGRRLGEHERQRMKKWEQKSTGDFGLNRKGTSGLNQILAQIDGNGNTMISKLKEIQESVERIRRKAFQFSEVLQQRRKAQVRPRKEN